MKQKIKILTLFILSAIVAVFATGCADNATPYETNNKDNYTVSVKYDANGGSFTTNTSVIVDSFNLNELNKNNDSSVQIALLSPDNSKRGNDAFTVTKNGYFLAGWYKQRIESTDSNGDVIYTYAEKWDFDDDTLSIDTAKEYSSDTPVLTLYAAWIPMFKIEFYSIDSGELVDTIKIDPTEKTELSLPVWSEETGAIDMFDFPKREGYTYSKAYLDADATQELTGLTITHPGSVDLETATAQNDVLKLYVDWQEGEWYRIYNAEQMIESASLKGNYEICADLDFANEIWPTSFMYGNFEGVIKGNGHIIKNVEFSQTNNSKVNAGLFGYLTETANISDLTFENIKFTIKSGTRKVGTNYGLFAGTISEKASISNVKILSSTLLIDSSCYFGVDDYSIGLVCGMGDASVVGDFDISCTATGDNPENLKISINDNKVTVDFEN